MDRSAIADLVDGAARGQLPQPDECRRLREAAGLTRQEAAHAMGVSMSSLASWEAGRCRPRSRGARAWRQLIEALKAASAE